MMKNLLLSFGLILAASASSAQRPGAPVDAASRAEILTVREAVWRAWFGGDTARLAQAIPNALAAGHSQFGWSTRANSFKDSREFATDGGKLVSLRFEGNEFDTKGRVVVLVSRFTYTTELSGKRETIRGVATEVFVKENGKWVHPFWYLDTR